MLKYEPGPVGRSQSNYGENYFEKGLELVSAFRAARKTKDFGAALSKFDAIKKEFSEKEDGAGALAAAIWMDIEAYEATGKSEYARDAKQQGDVLISEPIQKAKDKLLAASSLLQLYEFSRNEKYKGRAEDLLKSFEDNHMFYTSSEKRKSEINKLAAITYLNAFRVAKAHVGQAKRFLDSAEKSLLLSSEASGTFNSKKYRNAYKELLKSELENPERSAESLAGVLNEPLFNVERYDPDLGTVRRAQLHAERVLLSAGKKFLYHALPLASKAVYGMGGLADWFGGALERKGASLADAGWEKTGRAAGKFGRGAKFFFGTETLKRTSIVVGGSGVLPIPGLAYVANVSLGGAVWSGDINYFEQNEGAPSDYHCFIYGIAHTPVISRGLSTFGPVTGITVIPYVHLSVNPRIDNATIGLPGYAAFWFGKVGTDKPGQYARGPYMGVNIGFGFSAFSASIYYPPLGPLVDYLLKKPADWLRKGNDAALERLKNSWMRTKFHSKCKSVF